MKHTLGTAFAAATIALLAAACSDDSKSSSTTKPVVETAAPTTTEQATTTTTAPLVALPAKQGTLAVGTNYKVGRVVLQRALQLTGTADGQRGIAAAGRLWIYSDENVYVTLTDITQLRVFNDPQFDPTGTTDFPDKMMEVTQPMPQDPLAWAAALPGIQVSAITETTFGGQPARTLTYQFTDIPGTYPCPFSTSDKCVTGLFVPGNGSTGVFLPGDNTTVLWLADDSGTLYELKLGDRTYLIDVSNVDGAAELAASIVIGD